jgi:hypothetical protein
VVVVGETVVGAGVLVQVEVVTVEDLVVVEVAEEVLEVSLTSWSYRWFQCHLLLIPCI